MIHIELWSMLFSLPDISVVMTYSVITYWFCVNSSKLSWRTSAKMPSSHLFILCISVQSITSLQTVKLGLWGAWSCRQLFIFPVKHLASCVFAFMKCKFFPLTQQQERHFEQHFQKACSWTQSQTGGGGGFIILSGLNLKTTSSLKKFYIFKL